MIKTALRVSVFTTCCLMIASLIGAQAEAKPQPLMKISMHHLKKAQKHNAQGSTQPAKQQLEKALKVLKAAAWDKGGHRIKAIAIIKKALAEPDPAQITILIDQAMEEVQTGISHSDERPTQQPQPLMKLALHQLHKAGTHHEQQKPLITREHLSKALDILKRAAWDKGGHRVKAIHFIKQALRAKRPVRVGELIAKATSEVQNGVDFADSH